MHIGATNSRQTQRKTLIRKAGGTHEVDHGQVPGGCDARLGAARLLGADEGDGVAVVHVRHGADRHQRVGAVVLERVVELVSQRPQRFIVDVVERVYEGPDVILAARLVALVALERREEPNHERLRENQGKTAPAEEHEQFGEETASDPRVSLEVGNYPHVHCDLALCFSHVKGEALSPELRLRNFPVTGYKHVSTAECRGPCPASLSSYVCLFHADSSGSTTLFVHLPI